MGDIMEILGGILMFFGVLDLAGFQDIDRDANDRDWKMLAVKIVGGLALLTTGALFNWFGFK